MSIFKRRFGEKKAEIRLEAHSYSKGESSTDIYVPALVEDDRLIVSAFRLDKAVKYLYFRYPPDYRKTKDLSCIEYQSLNPPTLAELRHAYFSRNAYGFVCPDYRQSRREVRQVPGSRSYGEWTATFLRDGKEIVERPEKVFYDEKRELWLAEGGKVTKIELPPQGWCFASVAN